MPLSSVGRRAIGSAPVAVLVAGLLAQTVALGLHARKLWFLGDDWAFLLHRDLGEDTIHTLFAPHNEHWVTVPILAYRLLFHFYGAGSYLPYAAMPIVAHVVLSAVVFLALRRAGVGSWPAVLAALLMAFIGGGAGAENTLWDFQIAFVGSALFGVLALLAAQMWTRLWNVIAVLALVLSLMCSGMGIVMTVWVAIYVLLRRGLLSAVAIAIVPAVVHVVWYLAIGRGHSGAPPADLEIAPQAAMSGLAGVWTTATAMDGAGPVVLAVLAGVLLLRRHTPEQFALCASGLVGLVLCFFLLGYARSGLGIEALGAHRYLYFGVLMTAPALALTFDLAGDHLRERPWAAPLSWVVAIVAIVSLGLSAAAAYAELRGDAVQIAKDRLVAARQLVHSGEPLLSSVPDRYLDPDIAAADLDGVLKGQPPGGEATTQARLDARSSMQVGVRPTDLGLAAATNLGWFGFSDQPAGWQPLTGCVTRTAAAGARVVLPTRDAGAQVKVTTDGGVIETILATDRGASARGSWTVGASPTYVGATAPHARLQAFVQPGEVVVCPQ